ncbi:hypothetical protein, conserved [Eimeria tenella]|uniref:Uncharacterized protein n=1 Tax=Eimeria tenella TaxID=5802 RepID=U6L1B0_EIMTE|nr:hypothetical protein, conserved [Eimeria tenella]CDJ42389.1 hypothetical protein, conserved [Eimeria tenella]|eukprot:XP_013233139.1 hypothetical protein, conserved [Eimeria tenella]
MARWVSSDSAGRLCFFDCANGSRVVHPYIRRSSSSSSSSCGTGNRGYFEKLLQSHCSCLTFSGGWGGYDETEVTLGTSEGGIFAIKSHWPAAAPATTPAAAPGCGNQDKIINSSSSGSTYFDFPETEGKAEVLRCASLPYSVLLVQMLGVHTPQLRRLLSISEAAAGTAAAAEAEFLGLGDAVCCSGSHSAGGSAGSSGCCCCHMRSSELFGSDRQLLAVDKGGNGVVLDWSGSSSSSDGLYEANELKGFSLREPLCCCSSNSLLQQQLAVASATAASFLSVFDIEANAFCFYAHAPPAATAAKTILRCSTSNSSKPQSSSTSADAAAPAGSSNRGGGSSRLPVYADVSPPWCQGPSASAVAAAAAASSSSSKLQQQVCTSVTWLPRLGPSILCGVTADALLLLYDTRASSYPVYLTSTSRQRGPEGTPGTAPTARGAPSSAGPPRPMVYVGAQPGLVAAYDEMEAAVLPCCCCCCSCAACKSQRRGQMEQQQQRPRDTQQHEWQQESLFEGHRSQLVLKPHATHRKKHGSSSSSSLRLLSSKLRQRIDEDFDGLIECCMQRKGAKPRRQSSSSSSRISNSSSKSSALSAKAESDAKVTDRRESEGAHAGGCTASSNQHNLADKYSSTNTSSSKEAAALRQQLTSWWAALVSVSSSSDSPLTSFPAASAAATAAKHQQQGNSSLPHEAAGWLATSCYTLVACSLSLLLTEKHMVRRKLLQQTLEQQLLLLRSSCPPVGVLQPASGASNVKSSSNCAGNSGCGGKNGGCADDPVATAAARPSKKARPKGGAAAPASGKASVTADPAAALLPDAAAPQGKQQLVLQQFCNRVVRLLRLLDPADGSNSRSILQLQQQVQQNLPSLLHLQRQNALRLLEYCAAFCFCFSQSSLGAPCPPWGGASPDTSAAMLQAEMPAVLLRQAAKEVLRSFRRAAGEMESTVPAATDAAREFIGNLRMGFGLSTQQQHLLFSVLVCWQRKEREQQPQREAQKQQNQQNLEQDKLSSVLQSGRLEDEGDRQQRKDTESVDEAPEVCIQRNCISRLPITDRLYFSIARRQRNTNSRGRENSEVHSSGSRRNNKVMDPIVDTARLICCDTAGEISVLQVCVRRFRSHKEKQLHVHCSAAASATANRDSLQQQEQEQREQQQETDKLTRANIWFPQLPSLVISNTRAPAQSAAAAEPTAQLKPTTAAGSRVSEKYLVDAGGCSCRCCSSSYTVDLEMSFVAPRSSSSSSNIAVHSNGSYLLVASRDPYFALYAISKDLPLNCSNAHGRMLPLLGLALPPVTTGSQEQHQQPTATASADFVQPLLLSALPLLPCVPLPTSLPPYLAAPPVPLSQVWLQRCFQHQVQQQLQQQGAATPAAGTDSGMAAAWDTSIEFADWISEPDEAEFQPVEEED